MFRLACLVSGLVLAGCLLDTGGDKREETSNQCTWESDDPQAFNPSTLDCEWVGGACGPQTPNPAPSWASCDSDCRLRDEADCTAEDGCRVTRYALSNGYLGCYPTDQDVSTGIPCHGADALDCSRNPRCWALHTVNDSPDAATSVTPAFTTTFQLCIPANTSPGACVPAECDRTPPTCPEGTTPGVADGCYTNACIPDELCDRITRTGV